MRPQAAEHNPEAWVRAATKVICAVAKSRKVFTSDDIWAAGLLPCPIGPGLGVVMQALKRAAVIETTGYYVRCQKPSRHRGLVAVWKAANPRSGRASRA